jgi:purine-binding chemotaxis protein CheW
MTDAMPVPWGALLCRAGDIICALPFEHVDETMRPLPVEPLAAAPSFVSGLSVIRGATVPVVSLGVLLSGAAALPTRFVTIKTGPRYVALAVDAVVGVRTFSAAGEQLPPLLQHVHADVIAAVGTLDSALMIVLRTARLVPDQVWAALDDLDDIPA